eukprot:3704660-Pyramimonas_sp.AAC.1
MRGAVQCHGEFVGSGCAGRRRQAPGALGRSERLQRGPVTFPAPSGRGQGSMNRVALAGLRGQ